jgi:hypothetical protein
MNYYDRFIAVDAGCSAGKNAAISTREIFAPRRADTLRRR